LKLVGTISKQRLADEHIVRLDYPPFDVVIVSTDTGIFALEDACNHASASLAEGWVEDHCLICPVHQDAFDLETGALIRPKGLCGDQRTFVVRDEGDLVAIYDPFKLTLLT